MVTDARLLSENPRGLSSVDMVLSLFKRCYYSISMIRYEYSSSVKFDFMVVVQLFYLLSPHTAAAFLWTARHVSLLYVSYERLPWL